MTGAPVKRHRFAWIVLVCGLVSFAAAVIFAIAASLGGWSVTAFLRVLTTSLLGLFWVLLYLRAGRSGQEEE